MNPSKQTKKIFGDFQTPIHLSNQCIHRLKRSVDLTDFNLIVEPTCGIGNFLKAVQSDSDAKNTTKLGVDINQDYLKHIDLSFFDDTLILKNENIFTCDWNTTFHLASQPTLILGNPPWVTTSTLGELNGVNRPNELPVLSTPKKALDSLTGKSNYDVSEWIALNFLNSAKDSPLVLALIVKTSVARKLCATLWEQKRLYSIELCMIDTQLHFGAAVESCFLIIDTRQIEKEPIAKVFNSLELNEHPTYLRYDFQRQAVFNGFEKTNESLNLLTKEKSYRWRSGVKHDCSKVLELTTFSNDDFLYLPYAKFFNGLNESVLLETASIFPLLKSSDLMTKNPTHRKWLLMPQMELNQATHVLAQHAPLVWAYLLEHQLFFNNRKSKVYVNKDPFSVFGLGSYTFSPWKVCISSMYKRLNFSIVHQHHNKPFLLDDTCYFLPAYSEEEAQFLLTLLTSEIATEALKSLIFWDNKRPVTIQILQQLDLAKIAQALGLSNMYLNYTRLPLFQ